MIELLRVVLVIMLFSIGFICVLLSVLGIVAWMMTDNWRKGDGWYLLLFWAASVAMISVAIVLI